MSSEIAVEKLAELKELGGDALVTKLLGKFVENSARLLTEAATAVAAGDSAKVDYCIHTLKGSALSLGLSEMSDILVKLNIRTKAKNLEGADADLKKLQLLLDEVAVYKAAKFP